jgi:hypothetical protein
VVDYQYKQLPVVVACVDLLKALQNCFRVGAAPLTQEFWSVYIQSAKCGA